MLRRKRRVSHFRAEMDREENSNPMESVANLVDVMLVFACGLMLAIINYWQVDLNRVMDVVTQENLVEVENMQEAIEDGSIFEDLDTKGFVYEDPETGKMYIISK